MKRLYVRPGHAARGGPRLVAAIIAAAEQRGYAEMRLDSLPTMTEATALYRRFGLVEIPAYCYNPVPGTVYWRSVLAAKAQHASFTGLTKGRPSARERTYSFLRR